MTVSAPVNLDTMTLVRLNAKGVRMSAKHAQPMINARSVLPIQIECKTRIALKDALVSILVIMMLESDSV
jgi:hypothetical protein